MSIHSSLRGGDKNKKPRSVLKRYERLRHLKDKNLWDESKPVLGIPKVKMQRLKIKKEKAVAADAATPAGAAPVAGKAAPAAAAKTAPVTGAPKTDKK